MTLKNWLAKQGYPHGMECVGEMRLQQLWDAAQEEEREAIIMTIIPGGSNCDPQEICDRIRERSNAALTGAAESTTGNGAA